MPSFFKSYFGEPPKQKLFVPGRVNLMGEHTDYNGGMVLPTALTLGLNIEFTKRQDHIIHIISETYPNPVTRPLGDGVQSHWSDHIIGAFNLAYELGWISQGANIAIESNLPTGAGLSSSAAITVGVLKCLATLTPLDVTDQEIAKFARDVENKFIGVPCGIMDQMAVAIARPGHALALETDSLDYEIIPLTRNHHMAVIHSGITRELSDGRYKIRKEECDIIKSVLGLENICKISEEEFKALSHLPVHIQKRARHLMSEHKRTVTAARYLKTNAMKAFGQLMVESHMSMRDDFDITLPAIDELIRDACDFGATGARMTGGGFGGCIVACVPETSVHSWRHKLLEKHQNASWVA